MKIYISGKITGVENEAPLLFEKAQVFLENLGHEIINPLKIKHVHDLSWSSFMKADLKEMLDCDAIYMLKGWQDSKGACIERRLADELGMQIMYENIRV